MIERFVAAPVSLSSLVLLAAAACGTSVEGTGGSGGATSTTATGTTASTTGQTTSATSSTTATTSASTTSSSAQSTGSGAMNAHCTAVCAKGVQLSMQLNCAADPSCVASCDGLYTQSPGCTAQLDALIDCITTTSSTSNCVCDPQAQNKLSCTGICTQEQSAVGQCVGAGS